MNSLVENLKNILNKDTTIERSEFTDRYSFHQIFDNLLFVAIYTSEYSEWGGGIQRSMRIAVLEEKTLQVLKETETYIYRHRESSKYDNESFNFVSFDEIKKDGHHYVMCLLGRDGARTRIPLMLKN